MLRGAALLAAAVTIAAAADVGSLRVDGLPLPALGVTASPYISAALPAPGDAATTLLVTVRREGGGPIDAAGAEVWSGNTSLAGTGGPTVKCGVALLPAATFVVSAVLQDATGTQRTAGEGSFDTGLFAEADWQDAPWVGAGHGEFTATFTLPAADAAARRGRAYVSAPGGHLLYLNGELIGSDTIGVAPWLDWTRQMHSRTHDVSSALRSGANHVLLKTGCGAWCPSAAPTWAHSGRMIHTPAGAQPLARLLLTAGSRCDPALYCRCFPMSNTRVCQDRLGSSIGN